MLKRFSNISKALVLVISLGFVLSTTSKANTKDVDRRDFGGGGGGVTVEASKLKSK